MALFHITIEKVVVKDNNEEVIKLLKEIKALLTKQDEVAKLEKQMDEWLAQLDQAFNRLEDISNKV